MREIDIKGAVDYLMSADNYLVYTHVNPDADAVGSACALIRALRSVGKKAIACSCSPVPERLQFIPEADGRLEDYYLPHGQPIAEGYTRISVDVASENQLGDLKFDGETELTIDHHHINRIPCKRRLLFEDYPAAGEIVFEMIKEMGIKIDRAYATMLYAAISSDSGGFRYSSTLPKTHICAAELLETGIDFAKINRRLFEMKTPIQTKLEQAAYNLLEYRCNGKVAFVALDEDVMNKIGATESDVDCVNQIPRQIIGVEVSALLRPAADGNGTKVSLRSNDYFDVAELAKTLGGGGHIHAAGCRFPGMTVAQAKEKLAGILEGLL